MGFCCSILVLELTANFNLFSLRRSPDQLSTRLDLFIPSPLLPCSFDLLPLDPPSAPFHSHIPPLHLASSMLSRVLHPALARAARTSR